MSTTVVRIGLAGVALLIACSSDPAVTPVAEAGPDVDAGLGCGDGSQLCGSSCTAVARDIENCGACGVKCPTGEVCSRGLCALECTGGTTKCGSGCVDTKSDGANCGACGAPCASGEVCNGGKCSTTCGAGTTQCGSSCVNAQTDQVNCGGCGKLCKSGEQCVAGKCQLSCQAGLTLCSKAPADAGLVDASSDGGSTSVCANLTNDDQNCGACGTVCATGFACVANACTVGCNPPLLKCNNSSCVDPRFDPDNCNACGTVCPSVTNGTRVCINGVCSGTCAQGLSVCGTSCINLQTSGSNCGACGNVCANNATCTNGTCPPLFDSLTGAQFATNRAPGNSCGTQLAVGQDVPITAIAVTNTLSSNGNLKFMIWTHPAHVLVYVSAPKAFPAGGQQWRQSDPFTFTLQAGKSYDIGAIADVGATWFFDAQQESVPPFLSATSNPDWTNFASPTVPTHGGADCGIRLF